MRTESEGGGEKVLDVRVLARRGEEAVLVGRCMDY